MLFCMCRTIKMLISNWPRKLKFSQFLQAGKTCQLLLTFLIKVTRWSHSTSNFYALIGQNLTGEFMWTIYAISWNLFTLLKLTEFCVNLWCFWLSFSTECTKWNSAAIKSLLLFMASLFTGFLVEKYVACQLKVGNPISDGIVCVFHLAWCVRGLKSLKRFWPYFIVFSASRMVSLGNYCIWRLFLYLI